MSSQYANVREDIVTLQQYRELIENAALHYKPVLVIAFNTGMRLGEIKQLQWSHIDLKNSMIRLPKDAVKENRNKRIPINHHLKTALSGIVRAVHHDFVIHYKGTPMNGPSSLKKQFPETCARAGVPYGRKTPGGVTFHDLRRSVKSNMVEAGLDSVYRDLILGHALQGMDRRYLSFKDKRLTRAMDKYTRWLDDRVLDIEIGQWANFLSGFRVR